MPADGTRREKKVRRLKPVKAPPGPVHSFPSFPIAGIGASAGGLEAFTQLLGSIPANTGMAFVLIQHLDPTHPSLLAQALAKATKMPVHEIQDGATPEPDHVYVIAPNTDIGLFKGAFTVLPREHTGKPHLPIDFFFRALAAERGGQAIGMVLSGTASDGTEGLRAIKAEGGVTLVQDPQTAKFSGMPQSAASSGVADLILPIPELAREIVRLARHPYVFGQAVEPLALQEHDADLKKVFVLVRHAVGVDLSEYKETTVKRRLARRLALRKIETVREYTRALRDDAGEAQALFDDLLIHVTSFFRDVEVFDTLKRSVFPAIMKHKQAGEPIRMWVTGCSTGEETYSLAIALLECLGDPPPENPIQIFGSDISDRAIEKARAGFYPDSAVSHLRPEQLRRFFTKVDAGYHISKSVRAICVFARHDVAHDPPFSRLDLVSCRNVLIYFNQSLQRRLLASFHHSLKQPGFLVLGRSEHVSSHPELFSPIGKSLHVFRRTAATSSGPFARLGEARHGAPPPMADRAPMGPAAAPVDVATHVDHLLLAQYAPPGVIVNERMEILQFRGRTGPYLESPPGQPQVNLLKMAREGLLSELRIALGRAKKEAATVRREGVRVLQNGSTRTCNIVVVPVPGLPESEGRLFAVLFEDVVPSATRDERTLRPVRGNVRGAATRGATTLEHELKATKEYLQSLIEEHQRVNDALASANDELVSSNEELQSMNEEMETAKEELQSGNEELTTLNDELHNRNQELSQLNDDLVNLLNSVEIPVVILDANRCIRRFTPKARSLMNILPADVGRPIEDIRPNVAVEHLDQQIAEVIDTVTMKEAEVQTRDGRWHRMQIRPYKTVDNKIDGAVVSFVDIDLLKRTVTAAEWARDYASGIVEAVQVPLVTLDERLAVKSANGAFCNFFGGAQAETEGRSLFELGSGQWDIPALRAMLGDMLATNSQFQGFEVEREFPRLGKRAMTLSARPVRSDTGPPTILLAIEDITDRVRGDRVRMDILGQAREAEAEAEAANRAKDRFLAVLSHELRTPLSTLLLQVELLRRGTLDGTGAERAMDAIERAAKIQAQLIADLLDVSRIVAGKLELELQSVNVAELVREALDMASVMAAKNSVALEAALDDSVGHVRGDPVRLRQVLWNLLANAIKFTPEGGRVTVRVEATDGRARIQVSDTGIGIEPGILHQIFDPFAQAGTARREMYGGLGLGLAIVRHLVYGHGGTVEAESPGTGKGSTFTVTLPLIVAKSEQGGPAELQPKPVGQPLPKARHHPDFSGVRILVVEDEAETREPLVALLGQTRAEVRGAASAEEAIRVFMEFGPQLLVCDIAMAGEDGFDLIRRIRALRPGRGEDIPAIALTALAGEETRREALAAGFQMHMAKPVDFDDLTEALMKLYRPGPTEREHEDPSDSTRPRRRTP
jgi:two-component system CheB/CheR fusion protein